MRRVVVTGVGAVTPIGNTAPLFWQGLMDGKCGVDFITKFDTADYPVKIAAEVKDFDYGCCMTREQARKSDLFTQYAMAAAVEAMQMSGLSEGDPLRTGVYVGSGIGGMQTLLAEANKLFTRGPSRVSPYFIPSMISNIAAGSIAMRFNAKGPCLPVVTACATGSHAIGEAYLAIAVDRADVILAGGTEAAICTLSVAGFTSCMALSERNDPARASIPFDKERDGFVMGEGAGILVLEDYEHAKARGANILAEVCGYGNTCDAYHLTAPDPEAEGGAHAMRLALAMAGEAGQGQVYVNAHGTSTPLNDKTETLAIKKALGEGATKAMISSTKSMTGHMLGASGAVEAIACVYALHEGMLPPTIGLMQPDPECDLDYIPHKARAVQADIALSLSLGFGGHNACLAFKPVKEDENEHFRG